MHTEERKYRLNTCCVSLIRWQVIFFSEEVTIAFIEETQREENGNRRMHLKALRDTLCDDPVDGHGYEQHILQGGTKMWGRNTTRENGTTRLES